MTLLDSFKKKATETRAKRESAMSFPSDSNHSDKELDFGHPFRPYQIQLDFMKSLYKDIEEGRIAIFESPTGTGKSLSLICGALKWLQDTLRARQTMLKTDPSSLLVRADDLTQIDTEEEPDWVKVYATASSRANVAEAVETYLAHRQRLEERLGAARENKIPTDQPFHKVKKRKAEDTDERDPLILSDTEELNAEDLTREPVEPANDAHLIREPQIVFASRTHSQLTQFVRELRKTRYGAAVRVVSTASRKHLCVNPSVSSLASASQINDKCLDLQQPGKKSCPYLKRGKAMAHFVDRILVEAMDVEDLVSYGQRVHACPYYATRKATADAQLLITPYQLLLQPDTRESVGVYLKNCVIIFDEAHNLVEAMNSAHSVSLSLSQIALAIYQTDLYIQRYGSRLSLRNKQLVQRYATVLNMLRSVLTVDGVDSALQTAHQFIETVGLENTNLYKLYAFANATKLPYKVSSCAESVAAGQREATVSETSSTRQLPLIAVQSFIQRLNEPDENGRILLDYGSKVLGYTLLHPAAAFAPIASQARAIIFAGGTMAPTEHYFRLLVPQVPKERLHVFSCDHVVPAENVLVLPIAVSPSGRRLCFTYDHQSKAELIGDLGLVLVNASAVVPGGVVVFFPSFQFLDAVWQRFEITGVAKQFAQKGKALFREPTDAKLVESTLRSYSRAISEAKSQRGALLFCVMGGKMSEGINFSDDLARCVCVVGLPFPNVNSPILKEKMRFLDSQPDKSLTGRAYYLNLCMRSVNQSIGRAIRHIGDYAAILLIDHRFGTPQIQSQLPGWIKRAIPDELRQANEKPPSFGRYVAHLGKVQYSFLAIFCRLLGQKNKKRLLHNTFGVKDRLTT